MYNNKVINIVNKLNNLNSEQKYVVNEVINIYLVSQKLEKKHNYKKNINLYQKSECNKSV